MGAVVTVKGTQIEEKERQAYVDYLEKKHGRKLKKLEIEIDGDTITNVKFLGGCSGNTQGVAALVKGMNAEEAIERLEGIRCGARPTSCPDQLATAIKEALDI